MSCQPLERLASRPGEAHAQLATALIRSIISDIALAIVGGLISQTMLIRMVGLQPVVFVDGGTLDFIEDVLELVDELSPELGSFATCRGEVADEAREVVELSLCHTNTLPCLSRGRVLAPHHRGRGEQD